MGWLHLILRSAFSVSACSCSWSFYRNLTVATVVSHAHWNHGARCHTSLLPPWPASAPPLMAASSPCPCVCLTRSPCFDSIADVVQSHGGVFMDSSYPSSPVMGPLSRGQRRASEVSIASQVSGMADSYTATSIANSKCSQYQRPAFSSLTHTIWSSPSPLCLFFQISPSLLSLFFINLTLNTPCTQPGAF